MSENVKVPGSIAVGCPRVGVEVSLNKTLNPLNPADEWVGASHGLLLSPVRVPARTCVCVCVCVSVCVRVCTFCKCVGECNAPSSIGCMNCPCERVNAMYCLMQSALG